MNHSRKRRADTPNGMICSACKQDKPRYHFFNYGAKSPTSYPLYNSKRQKVFFLLRIPDTNDVCFTCGGPYRCIECGKIKDADQFRVQGRVCHSCKVKRRTPKNTPRVSL